MTEDLVWRQLSPREATSACDWEGGILQSQSQGKTTSRGNPSDQSSLLELITTTYIAQPLCR